MTPHRNAINPPPLFKSGQETPCEVVPTATEELDLHVDPERATLPDVAEVPEALPTDRTPPPEDSPSPENPPFSEIRTLRSSVPRGGEPVVSDFSSEGIARPSWTWEEKVREQYENWLTVSGEGG